jgi:hypothetical protein
LQRHEHPAELDPTYVGLVVEATESPYGRIEGALPPSSFDQMNGSFPGETARYLPVRFPPQRGHLAQTSRAANLEKFAAGVNGWNEGAMLPFADLDRIVLPRALQTLLL